MPDIRLVVTDLDDTLLDPEKNISAEAVELIARLQHEGVLFAFITGRPPYAVQRFADAAGIAGPLVGCNGAVVYSGGRVLFSQAMPLAPLQPLMQRAAAQGLTVLLYADGVEYALAETEWTRSREAAGRSVPIKRFAPGEWESAEAIKVNLMAGGHNAAFEALAPAVRELSALYSVAVYGNTGCEIVAKQVNKATGLRALCKEFAIPLQSTLAVGDNENDISMLEAAGVGAAVANASESAKRAADYVCKAPYTAGVVEAIRRFVYNETEV